MVRRSHLLLLAALALIALVPASPAAAQGRTITMSGASPAQAVVADLVFYYRREHRNAPRFRLTGGGTGTGIVDAARGVVSAGMSGRELTESDPAGLVFTPLARSGICLVTNPANPLPNLTRAQLQLLVSGQISDWSQLPGAALSGPLAPVGFDLASAARSVFVSTFIDPATALSYTPVTYTGSAQVRDYVQVTRAAWGYVDQEFARSLHTVAYEGVPCTRRTISNGSYPAQRTLGFVTRGKPRGELARFFRWIRRDATAKRVIATRYIVP